MLIAIYFFNVLNYILKEKAGQRKVKRVWSKLREEGEREKEQRKKMPKRKFT